MICRTGVAACGTSTLASFLHGCEELAESPRCDDLVARLSAESGPNRSLHLAVDVYRAGAACATRSRIWCRSGRHVADDQSSGVSGSACTSRVSIDVKLGMSIPRRVLCGGHSSRAALLRPERRLQIAVPLGCTDASECRGLS